MKITVKTLILVIGAMATTVSGATQGERIADLERKVEILTQELEKNQFSDIMPEPGEGVYGLGASASKVYQKDQGISIGGYGEGFYSNYEGDKTDVADFLRGVLYFGFKYNDQWVFNSEIEFEHASTSKDGSASVEFAYLDYLASPFINFRAGLLIIPVGLVNELHEPTAFLSAQRPDVENRIIPTTWRENGVGLFGEAGMFSYKVYLVNGLDGSGFSAKGVRGGRQKGSKASAEDLAGVVRVDMNPAPGLTIGGSVYHGNSGQDVGVDASTTIAEGHVDMRHGPYHLRFLAAQAQVDDVAELNRIIASSDLDEGETAPADADIDSIGEEMFGWYAEAGVDVFALMQRDGEASLTPFVRYEEYNTQEDIPAGFKQSGQYNVEVVTVGVNFKPIDEVVFKADFQMYDDAADAADDRFNLSMGYIF